MIPRSRLSIQNSGIQMSSQQRAIWDETPLITKPTDPLIEQAVNDGKLHIASSKRIKLIKNQLLSQENLTFCCILPNSISMPHSNWDFIFDIYIPYAKKVKIKNNKYKNYQKYKLEKVYVYKTFRASYLQLQRVDNRIITQMSDGHKYFALSNEGYPAVDNIKGISNKRGDKLMFSMKKESEFIIKAELASNKKLFKLFGKRSATHNDLLLLSSYLNRIFSSPSLCRNDFIFDELHFDSNIKQLLRSLASNKLDAWHSITDRPSIKDPIKLQYKLGKKYEFHTIYIVRRPLNDKSLKLFNFNHWAIKAEGVNHLLTTEFFAYNSKHGIVETQILLNTAINRRVFWYWWQKDPHDDNQKEQYFTDKWENIETIYVGKIHCECISKLICKWLTIHSNHKYSVTTNNCQHYVRDLCTILDINIARKLNGLMDHRLVAAAIPAAALADGMSEEARTNEVYDKLIKIVKQYDRDMKKRRAKELKIDQATKISQNWRDIAAELKLEFDDNDDDKQSDNDNDNDNDNNSSQNFYDNLLNQNNDFNNNSYSNMEPTPSHSHSHSININIQINDNINNNNNNNSNNQKIFPNMNRMKRKSSKHD